MVNEWRCHHKSPIWSSRVAIHSDTLCCSLKNCSKIDYKLSCLRILSTSLIDDACSLLILKRSTSVCGFEWTGGSLGTDVDLVNGFLMDSAYFFIFLNQSLVHNNAIPFPFSKWLLNSVQLNNWWPDLEVCWDPFWSKGDQILVWFVLDWNPGDLVSSDQQACV